MSAFYHEEPPEDSKRCKLLAMVLKNVCSNCQCHSDSGRLSLSSPVEEFQTTDFNQEQEVVVSEIRSRAMEKLRRKSSPVTDSLAWVVSPRSRELYLKAHQQKDDEDEEDEEDGRDEFFSVGSSFPCYSSAVSREAYYPVKTNFSCCSPGLKGFDFQEFQKLDFQDLQRSIIQELCLCEGWPFGLCRRAVLLPPLPKSPSESWSWHKGTKIAKFP
ncbi:uncharacterized protein LOC123203704 [Mangifera indica]|uniref:uncharacterized protein LOC123203704 n=1 Tax=Mangifera indica TaxID=29780 RepID=UPI001CFA1B3B|nr:uncharacterized protein LOC123203704 [Mangifera indica]XP_044476089.1 uncharacterized protein LOC123203704 [Mangifera indica]